MTDDGGRFEVHFSVGENNRKFLILEEGDAQRRFILSF